MDAGTSFGIAGGPWGPAVTKRHQLAGEALHRLAGVVGHGDSQNGFRELPRDGRIDALRPAGPGAETFDDRFPQAKRRSA